MATLRKLTTAELLALHKPKDGKDGQQGPQGPAGKDGVVSQELLQSIKEELRQEVEKEIKKRPTVQHIGTVGDPPVKYWAITTASFTIPNNIVGYNIFGVQYSGGPVTVTLPKYLINDAIISIKDETGNASSNNITVVAQE